MSWEKTRVLCVFDVVKRWGGSTITYQDSVMLEEIEFKDQILPSLSAYMAKMKSLTVGMIGWEFKEYLPQTPLKPGKRILN